MNLGKGIDKETAERVAALWARKRSIFPTTENAVCGTVRDRGAGRECQIPEREAGHAELPKEDSRRSRDGSHAE